MNNKKYLFIGMVFLALAILIVFLNSKPSNLPANIEKICLERTKSVEAFKVHSCSSNSAKAEYALRLEATGDAGTNYYDSNGNFLFNCGALTGVPDNEGCAVVKGLCSEVVSC